MVYALLWIIYKVNLSSGMSWTMPAHALPNRKKKCLIIVARLLERNSHPTQVNKYKIPEEQRQEHNVVIPIDSIYFNH